MAVNFDALSQVYNHYMTEYAPKSNTALDTHKKSDLRKVYNSMVKINKESPLYILDKSPEAKTYAIGLKESARSFRNSVAATQSNLEGGGVLEQKSAFSTRPEIAEAKYLGEENGAPAPTFDLSVSKLASGQVNIGKMLPSDQPIIMAPGDYSFDMNINDIGYEFQFQVRGGDTNKSIQERLSRLINNADIGIESSILEDGEGNSGLKLESTQTGIANDRNIIFQVSDDNTSQRNGVVEYLGLDQIDREPSNAEFDINGIARTASSNTFTVEKQYEITLKGISPEEGIYTQIGVKDDTDSLSENIHSLVDSYNTFLNDVFSGDGSHAKGHILKNELGYITRNYAADLESVGLSFEADGSITVDDDRLKDAASRSSADELFSPVKDFANSMLRKTNQISLDPLQYVNKTVVAYKNPGKNYPSPYVTSAYSGLLFNNYC